MFVRHHCNLRTPLDKWHESRGALFSQVDGWRLPVTYSEVAREISEVGSNPGIADLSAFAKVELQGQGVGLALSKSLHHDPVIPVGPFEVGQGDLACRLTDDRALAIATHTNPSTLISQVNLHVANKVTVVRDVTCHFAALSLVGPSVRDVLSHVTALNISTKAFAPGSCAETKLLGVAALLVCPPRAQTDEIRAYVGWELGEFVFLELLKFGARYSMVPIGTDAWRRLACGRH